MDSNFNMKVCPDELIDLKQNDLIYNKTPDISAEFDKSATSIRFLRQSLISGLETFVRETKNIPIEKFEIDLFNATQLFNNKLHGNEISINCVRQLHHIQKLSDGDILIDSYHEEMLKSRIETIMISNPLISAEYSLFIKLLDLFNSLFVKWGIASLKNYDYRHTGRSLNVKMLDLRQMNSCFMTIDILWISTKIFSKPLNVLANPVLIEIAIVLHDQIKKCCKIFLELNPKIIDPNYQIERVIAFASEKFHRFSDEVLPEANLTMFKHAELSIAKGIMKCFGNPNPKTDLAYRALVELELSYRSFEKNLIGNVLKVTGKADF